MKIGGIIFSRMSSSRLPGKAKIEISGKNLLSRVIERSKKISMIDHLCLATSINDEDNEIEELALSLGVEVYRGDLNDVAKRAYKAASKFEYTDFLRICADRPFFDYRLYDTMIQKHLESVNDLTTSIFPRTVPVGFTGEIVSVKALERLLSFTKCVKDREHVTRYFYNNPKLFSISNIDFNLSKEIINLKLAIDSEKDLKMAKWIINNSDIDPEYNSEKIFYLAKEWNKINTST